MNTLRMVKVFRLMRLLKLVRLLKLSKMGKRFDDLQLNPAMMSVLTLIMQLLLVAHFVACFWHYMTTPDVVGMGNFGKISWVSNIGMQNAPLFDRYVAAFYWCITTMISVGYGDIVPVNSVERIYAMCTELTGGIIFGAVISQVTRLIETRNPQARAYKEKMDELKAYLGEKLLPRSIRVNAKKAYSYYLIRKSSFAESGIFSEMPKDMLVKLINNIYEKEIREIQMFHQYPQRFVVELLIKAQPMQASPGEIITTHGDIGTEIIYIIHGVVRLLVPRGDIAGVVAGYATDGHYFGDFEFYKRTLRVAEYTVALGCSFLTIDFENIEALALEHADAYGQFMQEMAGRYKAFMLVSRMSIVEHSDREFKFETSSVWIDGVIEPTTDKMAHLENLQRYAEGVARHRVLTYDSRGHVIIKEILIEEMGPLYLLHPKGRRKVIWDVFVGMLIVYSVLSVPVQIAYNTNGNVALDYLLNSIFFIDMCLSFRTAYHEEEDDAYVIVPSSIYHRYIQSWFIIDFVSFFPFDTVIGVLLQSSTTGLSSLKLVKVVRLIRLVRLVRLAKLGHYLGRLEDQVGLNPIIFNLLMLILQVLFIAHMVSCLWWGTSLTHSKNDWMSDVLGVDMTAAPLMAQYIVSLYWTITTLSTVGYGEIHSVSTSERMLNVLIMILGATVFGYIVANVNGLMGTMNQASSRLVEKVSEVTEYLKEKNCPKLLSDTIIKHFMNMYRQQSVFDENAILSRLPRRLRNQILMHQHHDTIKKIPIFRYIKNTSVVMYLYQLLDAAYFDAGQFLLREGDAGHDVHFLTAGMAYVFRKGNLKFVKPRPDEPVKRRRQASIIGLVPIRRADSGSRGGEGGDDKGNSSSGESFRQDTKKTYARLTKETTPWGQYSEVSEMIANRGREFLGTIKAGEFFGHVANLTHQRHSASVAAAMPCTVYVLSRADIGRISREHVNVSLQLQAALARCIKELEVAVGKENTKLKRAAFIYNIRRDFMTRTAKDKGRKRRGASLDLSNGRGNLLRSMSVAASRSSLMRTASGDGLDDKAMASQKAKPAVVVKYELRDSSVAVASSPVRSEGKPKEDAAQSSAWASASKRAPAPLEIEGPESLAAGSGNAPMPVSVTPTASAAGGAGASAAGGGAPKVSKWKTVKAAVQNAKAMALVASMADNLAEGNSAQSADSASAVTSDSRVRDFVSPSESNSTTALLAATSQKPAASQKISLKPSAFARALRVSVGIASGAIFEDNLLMYDSDHDDDSNPLVPLKRVGIIRRVASCPTFTCDGSKAGTLVHSNSMDKEARSKYAMDAKSGEGDEYVDNGTSDLKDFVAKMTESRVGDAEKKAKKHRRRSMSFPSYDLHDWKEDHASVLVV